MRKMVMKMHLGDDEDQNAKSDTDNQENNAEDGFKKISNNVLTINTNPILNFANHVVPKDEMQRLQKMEESKQLKEQRERMAAREKAE